VGLRFAKKLAALRRATKGEVTAIVADAVSAHVYDSLFPHFAARWAPKDAIVGAIGNLFAKLAPVDFGVPPFVRLDSCERMERGKVVGTHLLRWVEQAREAEGLPKWEYLDFPGGSEEPEYTGEPEDTRKERLWRHRKSVREQRRKLRQGKEPVVPAIRVPPSVRGTLTRIAQGSYVRSIGYYKMLSQARTPSSKRDLCMKAIEAVTRSRIDYYKVRYPDPSAPNGCNVNFEDMNVGADERLPLTMFLFACAKVDRLQAHYEYENIIHTFVSATGSDMGAGSQEEYEFQNLQLVANFFAYAPEHSLDMILAAMGYVE